MGVASSDRSSAFGNLLRQYRRDAGLTQEELAEKANLSARAVSDLERGVKRTPWRDTVRMLADALALSADERAGFEAAVVRSSPAPEPAELGNLRLLPVSTTPFVGRTTTMQEVLALLRQPEVRLLTLTGPAGVGKTRLAVEAVGILRGDFPDGVIFVPLSALDAEQEVVPAVARALGARESGQEPLLSTVQAHLRARRVLLVLDNFEHVLGARVTIPPLLQACPHLTVLVTSREVLHLSGERSYPVGPLAMPDSTRLLPVEELSRYEAVELFVDRARASRHDFALTRDNASTIAEICRRLDGLPLAIELAAARSRHVPPGATLARLSGSDGTDDPGENETSLLGLLARQTVDVEPRQQTWRAALSWSFELLLPQEQALFRRLAVFSGEFTLRAVGAVCNPDRFLTEDVLDVLASLIDKSLVQPVDGGDDDGRYAMLGTIRAFALERLEEDVEAETVRRIHATFYLALTEKADSPSAGSIQGQYLQQIEVEHENLLTALRWALKSGEGELALRLATALWRFWDIRGYWVEGSRWIEEALAAAVEASLPVRARALSAAGHLAWRLGRYDRASAHYEESLAACREIADERGAARALDALGIVAASEGSYQRAAALQEEALHLARERGDERGMARSLNNLGLVAANQGDYQRAESLYQQSLALKRKLGDRLGMAATLGNLAFVAQEQGTYPEAAALQQASLSVYRDLGDPYGTAQALTALAGIERERGNYERARELIGESVVLFRETGHTLDLVQSVENVAQLAAAEGQVEHAAELFRAAEMARGRIGAPLTSLARAAHERFLSMVRSSLDERTWAAAVERGSGLALDEALTLGLRRPIVSET